MATGNWCGLHPDDCATTLARAIFTVQRPVAPRTARQGDRQPSVTLQPQPTMKRPRFMHHKATKIKKLSMNSMA
jgi:hypothetical protein